MKWVLRSLVGAGTLCAIGLAAVGALWWLLATEAGAAWLVGQARARTGGAVAIERVSGTVIGGIELTGVALRLSRDELDIDTLRFDWFAPAALTHTLALGGVHADVVRYRRVPGPPAARPIDLRLPFSIDVSGAAVDRIELAAGDDTIVLENASGRARLANGVLALDELAAQSRGVALAGSGSLRLYGGVHLAAGIDWSRPGDGRRAFAGGQAFAGRLALEGTFPVLDVHHELIAPVAMTADGELTIGTPLSVDVALQWRDLAWPGMTKVVSPAGRLTLAGSKEAYRYRGEGEVVVDGVAARVAVAGTGEVAALELESLALDSARGALSASGAVALDTLAAELDLVLEALDPSLILRDWPGRLRGTAHLSGALAPRRAAATALDLRGELRGVAVAARGGLRYEGDRLTLDALDLEAADSRARLDGALGLAADAALALDVDARIEALEAFVPDAAGSASVELAIGGTRAQPRVEGAVDARGLRLRDVGVARLHVRGAAGLAPQAPLDLTIDASRVVRGKLAARALRARLDGRTAEHAIVLDASADGWRAHGAAAGGWDGRDWRGVLESLALDEPSLGDWRLTSAASARVGAAGIGLENACFEHDSGSRGCAALALAGLPEDRLVVAVQSFDLRALRPLLPAPLAVTGVYQASASFVDLTRSPRGALAVSGISTAVDVSINERQSFSTVLENLTIGATLANGRLALDASVKSREQGRLTLAAEIDDVADENSPIGGALNVFWPDLSFLSLTTPDVGDIGGAIEVDMRVGGTREDPQVEGGASLRDGRVAVPQWGLTLERITAAATSPDGNALDYDVSGWAGEREVTMSGRTSLDPAAGWPTRLTLRGEAIPAVRQPDVEIDVSPQLEVTAQLPRIHVTGTLHVPRARIELSALPPAAIAPSADAVIHGGAAEPAELRSLLLTADVTTTLGNAVEYLGLDLVTKVTGELRLRRDQNRATTASGSLSLAGVYSAYGQTLQLERGQLLFNGPLADPTLDVRAVRTVDATRSGGELTRAGVDLTGSLKAPRSRVFTEPPMSEADSLSYLLLGRPVTGADGEETATLQSAALAMGLQQALPAVQRLGQSLGLDELTVQTTDTDAGALMAGKYLSPNLFIRYSYGLFNRIGGLLLRFRINERLSIETRSGDQKSMDLLYTVEKD